MAKNLTDEQLAIWRDVLTDLDGNVADWDNAARHPAVSAKDKYRCSAERDAWIAARDAVEKVVRREQERRVANE